MLADPTTARKPAASIERHDPRPQPHRKLRLGQRAGRERLPGRDVLGVLSRKIEAVEIEEHQAHAERRALVAINKGMVARQPEGVGRREFRQVRRAIGEQISGTVERAFEQSRIPEACRAAMLGKLPIVDQQGIIHRDPEGFASHLLGKGREGWAMLAHHALGRFGHSGSARLGWILIPHGVTLRRFVTQSPFCRRALGRPVRHALTLFHRQDLRLDTANMARPRFARQS